MKRIGLFYGTSTGNTEDAAKRIRTAFGEVRVDLHDIADCTPQDFADYDVLILGTSTWGYGDLQDDWDAFNPDNVDFTGKTVALFGLGDQATFPETFVDGMGTLYGKAIAGGAATVDRVSTGGYTHSDSTAVVDGSFVGLPLDKENQPELTGDRIEIWVASLLQEL